MNLRVVLSLLHTTFRARETMSRSQPTNTAAIVFSFRRNIPYPTDIRLSMDIECLPDTRYTRDNFLTIYEQLREQIQLSCTILAGDYANLYSSRTKDRGTAADLFPGMLE